MLCLKNYKRKKKILNWQRGGEIKVEGEKTAFNILKSVTTSSFIKSAFF